MNVSRYFKYGISFFIYSNLFIAFCSAAFTAKTCRELFHNNGNPHVTILIFCSTLLFYCFHRINKRKYLTPNENLEERINWMNEHKLLYYILISLSIVVLFSQLFYIPLRTWFILVPVAILAITYTFPLIPTPDGLKRLRDIYWLKTFWIALAFSLFTTFLPILALQTHPPIFKPTVLFIFFRNLVFLSAICIPFDIRDMHFDELKGVKTLPVLLGPVISIYISIILILLFISLICLQFLYFNMELYTATALFISALFTIILLVFAKKKRPALIYPLLFDSAMVLQYLLVLAFSHI